MARVTIVVETVDPRTLTAEEIMEQDRRWTILENMLQNKMTATEKTE